MQRKKRLLELVRDTMEMKGYGIRTQQCYLGWIREFILFHDKKHPSRMGKVEIDAFMDYIDISKRVAFRKRQEAYQAILFLYTQVLRVSLQHEYIQASRAKQPKMVQSVMQF